MTKRARFWIICGGVVALLASYIGGYLVGGKKYFTEMQNTVWGDRRSEFILIKENLERRDLQPQLREYLKDRLYVVASQLPEEAIRPLIMQFPRFREFDFGPVDRSQLRGVRATALGGLEGKSYEAAKARHHPLPAKLAGSPVQSNPTAESDARKGGARGSP
jgi:hypothetical protein